MHAGLVYVLLQETNPEMVSGEALGHALPPNLNWPHDFRFSSPGSSLGHKWCYKLVGRYEKPRLRTLADKFQFHSQKTAILLANWHISALRAQFSSDEIWYCMRSHLN